MQTTAIFVTFVAGLALGRRGDDEVRALVERGEDVVRAERLGDEVTDRLVEPLLGGVYAGRVDRLSLRATMPLLWAALADGDKDWTVTPHQRFAHSADYLRTMCARAGFPDIELFEPITVRLEQGAPIPGFLVVAARP